MPWRCPTLTFLDDPQEASIGITIEETISVFSIAVTVMVVVLKKLFYKKYF
jgi:hypothetical protein